MSENYADLLPIYDTPLYVFPSTEGSSSTENTYNARVLVLAFKTDLNEGTRELLSKMLTACQLQDAETQLIEVGEEDVLPFIQAGHWQYVLLFGMEIHNESLHVKKEKYKPFRFGGKAFLYAEALALIAGSPASKSSLWTQGLKPLFNLP